MLCLDGQHPCRVASDLYSADVSVEEWGDAIFAHFQKKRMTGAFLEGANGLAWSFPVRDGATA